MEIREKAKEMLCLGGDCNRGNSIRQAKLLLGWFRYRDIERENLYGEGAVSVAFLLKSPVSSSTWHVLLFARTLQLLGIQVVNLISILTTIFF